MAEKSMSLDELVRKLMGDEHADVLRETLAWFVRRADGGRGRRADRRRPARDAAPERVDASQRLPRARLGDARRRDRAGDPEAAQRQLLPELPRAAHALRAGAGRGRPGGLCQRRLDAQGRPPREPARARRHEQERGQPALRRPRRAGARLPRAAAGGRATRTCGWTPRSRRSASRGGVRSQGAGGRLRRARDGPPRGHRPRRRRGRDRGLLARVPARPAGPRPGRRAALRLRRPRGPEERDRQGARLPLAALHRALPARHARPLRQGAAADGLAAPSARSSPPRAPTRRASASPSVVAPWSGRAPKVARLLEEAEDDLLAFFAFPAEHWRSCARPTRWSASTARSAGAPTSSASSRTTPP